MSKIRELDPFKKVATLAAKNDLDQVKVLYNKSSNTVVIEQWSNGQVVFAETLNSEEYNSRQALDYAANIALN